MVEVPTMTVPVALFAEEQRGRGSPFPSPSWAISIACSAISESLGLDSRIDGPTPNPEPQPFGKTIYHVPRRAGKKLSIFFANTGYRITRDQPAAARDVTLRSARAWS
jgi:hypothetical protein